MTTRTVPTDTQEDVTTRTVPTDTQEEPAYAGVLTEISHLTPALLCRRAGLGAAREARSALGVAVNITVEGTAHYLDITCEGAPVVRYIRGGGWDAMVSKGSPAQRLEALVRLFHAQKWPWVWPESVTEKESAQTGPTPATREVCADVIDEIESLVRAGFAHIGQDGPDRLAGLGLDARVAGLPLLSRFLGTATALMESSLEGNDQVSEAQVMVGLGHCWGLAHALMTASGLTWDRLRGKARREFSETGEVEIHPLGASWWVASSGARGLTLIGWDGQGVRLATTARPAGSDPGFLRRPEMTGLWGIPVSTLLSGPFRIKGAWVSAEGVLSPAAESVSMRGKGLSRDLLDQVATEVQPTSEIGFGTLVQEVVLLRVDDMGQMVIDEARQQLVWSVSVKSETFQIRQIISPATDHRVEALLQWEEKRPKVSHVLVRRVLINGQGLWEPVSLFSPGKNTVALHSLDFPSRADARAPGPLRKQLSMVLRRVEGARALPSLPGSPITRVLSEVQDLIVDLGATGRLGFVGDQARRAEGLITRLDDLALASVAGRMRILGENPSPRALLGLQVVVDRAMTLALGAT